MATVHLVNEKTLVNHNIMVGKTRIGGLSIENGVYNVVLWIPTNEYNSMSARGEGATFYEATEAALHKAKQQLTCATAGLAQIENALADIALLTH